MNNVMLLYGNVQEVKLNHIYNFIFNAKKKLFLCKSKRFLKINKCIFIDFLHIIGLDIFFLCFFFF